MALLHLATRLSAALRCLEGLGSLTLTLLLLEYFRRRRLPLPRLQKTRGGHLALLMMLPKCRRDGPRMVAAHCSLDGYGRLLALQLFAGAAFC